MRILKVLIAICCVLFLSLQFQNQEPEASGLRALLVLLVIALYLVKMGKPQLYFLLFLITFGIAEILNFGSYFLNENFNWNDQIYFTVNGLYIISYIFLIFRILSSINIWRVIKKFPFHFVVLVVLNVYCVINITETSVMDFSQNEYIYEFVYNAVIMLLMSFALMNFVEKDDKKSMNLLLGCIFIAFSEFIQLTYFYILKATILNVVCSLFLMIAFLFFYLQARIPFDTKKELNFEDIYA